MRAALLILLWGTHLGVGCDCLGTSGPLQVPSVDITAPAEDSIINSLNMAAFTVSGTCSVNGQDVVVTASTVARAVCTDNTWSVVLDVTADPEGPLTVTADHRAVSGACAPQANRRFLKGLNLKLPVPVLAWSPLEHDFGSLAVGSTSAAESFTLTNTGNGAATGCSAPSVSDPANFVITSDGCGASPLGAGNSCTVQVAARPSSAGPASATLSRVCTVGGTTATTLNRLVATGLVPALAWSPLAHDFADINVGLSSPAVTFTLTNSGTPAATGCSAPTLSDSLNFTLVSDSCGTAALPGTGGACAVEVRATPKSTGIKTATLSRSCSLGGTVTTTANQLVTNGVTDTTGTVAAIYPVNGAKWNDYVRNYGSGTGLYDRADTACAGTEQGYFKCLHGAEKKKLVVAGFSSCSGLAASDQLGAFEWECVMLGGVPTVVSKGLKVGRGLRDLVNASGTAFQPNQVIVTKSDCTSPVSQSMPAVWWTNAVTPLPDNHLATDATRVLASPSTIYTLAASRDTMGYNVLAHKVAIVTLGTATLTPQAAIGDNCDDRGTFDAGVPIGGLNRAILCSAGKSYEWVEVSINTVSNPAVTAIYLSYGIPTVTSVFERVHRTSIAGSGGLEIDSVDSSLFSEFSSESANHNGNGDGNGFWFWSSNANTVLDARIVNPFRGGLRFDAFSTDNVVQRVTVSNSRGPRANVDLGQFVYAPGSTRNIFTHVTLIGSAGTSLRVPLGSGSNTFHAITLLSATDAGIDVTAENNTFSNVVVANNGATGVQLAGKDNAFTQVISAHNGGPAWSIAGAAINTHFSNSIWRDPSGTCAIVGSATELDTTCHYGPARANPMHPVKLNTTFLGPVSSDDSASTVDVNGAAPYALAMDWWSLESPFRGWGRDAPGFPAPALQGACSSGTCRIWDSRLSVTDRILRNVNGAFVAGAACPKSVSGAEASNVVTNATGTTYLLSATEIVGDFIGNENGLCESNEACLYSPNLGAYQGEGDPLTQTCTFVNGLISGVTMYAYPINGR